MTVVSSVVLVAWVVSSVASAWSSLPGPETNRVRNAKALRTTTAHARTAMINAKLRRDTLPPFPRPLRSRLLYPDPSRLLAHELLDDEERQELRDRVRAVCAGVSARVGRTKLQASRGFWQRFPGPSSCLEGVMNLRERAASP